MPTLIILHSPKSASLAVAVAGLRSLSRICMAVEHLLISPLGQDKAPEAVVSC